MAVHKLSAPFKMEVLGSCRQKLKQMSRKRKKKKRRKRFSCLNKFHSYQTELMWSKKEATANCESLTRVTIPWLTDPLVYVHPPHLYNCWIFCLLHPLLGSMFCLSVVSDNSGYSICRENPFPNRSFSYPNVSLPDRSHVQVSCPDMTKNKRYENFQHGSFSLIT